MIFVIIREWSLYWIEPGPGSSLWPIHGTSFIFHPCQHHPGPSYQSNSNLTVCSTVCSGWQQRKQHSSTLLALCEGNPPVTGGFPSQRASNTESISMAWHLQFLWSVPPSRWWPVDSPHKGPVMQKAFPCMTSSVSLICATTIKGAPSTVTTKTCTCHGLLTGQWQFLLTLAMAALSLSGAGTDHRRLACHDGGISKIVMAECGDGLGP